MQLVSSHNGRLYVQSQEGRAAGSRAGVFRTGLEALDLLAPGGAFERGVVHEVLWESGGGTPFFFALLLARAAAVDAESGNSNAVICCDPAGRLYPPAVAAMGIPLEQFFILRPPSAAQEIWAAAECLRCRGVAVTLAAPPRLTRVEARRLQLAAETGGGVGLLFRPTGAPAAQHAAATRWLIRPSPGERTVQRWSIQLIHGHGGQVGQSILLERHREYHAAYQQTGLVRAIAQLADRPAAALAPAVRVPA